MDIMLSGTTHEVHHAHDTAWFSRCLDTQSPFDLVCFDHDLGAGRTGLDAAEEFVLKHPPTLCLVHSWNAPGAELIRRVLRKAGNRVMVLPFSTALKSVLQEL